MPPDVTCSLILVAAYLIGSLPFGVLIGRFVRGVDVRRVGSGNIGATNVARSIGTRWGLVVLLLDGVKGATPVLMAESLAPPGDWQQHLPIAAGVVAICGHMFPLWLRFRGGKGVATTLGVTLIIAPVATGVAVVVFVATVVTTRIVSLGSILSAVGFGVAQLIALLPQPWSTDSWGLATFSVAVPALIIVRHRENLHRLRAGTEPRFGKKQNAEA